MKWDEIQAAYPDTWLAVEAIQRELMRLGFAQVDKRIEQVEKRFDETLSRANNPPQ